MKKREKANLKIKNGFIINFIDDKLFIPDGVLPLISTGLTILPMAGLMV